MQRSNTIWILHGRRFGDNQQMLALAHAITQKSQARVTSKPLHFTKHSKLHNIRRHGSLIGLTDESRSLLTPPWPQMIITAGRRTTAAALWVRAQAGGAVRLIHIGRPWAPLSWFDLVITTEQYQLPVRDNVIHNLMPLAAPVATQQKVLLPASDTLPRPWLTVAIGGSAPPYSFDDACICRLAARIDAFCQKTGGSALILAGPRTIKPVQDRLVSAVTGPHRLFPWGPGLPHFAEIAPLSDQIMITGDSASLMADAAALGKKMKIFPLSWNPSIRYALVQMVRPLVPKKLFSDLISAGLITSLRDMPAYSSALIRAGMTAGGPAAAHQRAAELNQAATACARLLAPWRIPEAPPLTSTAPLFEIH